MASEQFPPADARDRSVLVRNIPALADVAAVEEFFGFCGEIESKRLTPVLLSSTSTDASLEAIVVFKDSASCRTALLMTGSTILDTPVTITTVPEDYSTRDATNAQGEASDPTSGDQTAEIPLGGLMAGFGGLFSGVGSALSGEMARAGAMFDAATDSGVLKTAKDQAALAKTKTAELIQSVDAQYGVGERAGAVAGAVTAQTRTVVGAVAEQGKLVASQVDETLHVREHAKTIQSRAMENQAVATAAKSLKDGFDSLLSQTGLNNNQTTSGDSRSDATDAQPIVS